MGKVCLESGDLFDQMFEQHEEVGKGRFGVVYRVSEKPTGARRAAKLIKCIRKEEREKVRGPLVAVRDTRPFGSGKGISTRRLAVRDTRLLAAGRNV